MSKDQATTDVRTGYKRTEVGVIPSSWRVKQVIEVCDFIVPGRNKPKNFNGNIPWVTTPDLTDGGRVSESRSGLCVTEAEAQSVGSKIVPAGSVLMSCAGELGIVTFVERDIVINQQLHAFIPTEAIVPQYLMFALKTRTSYIDSVATKTAVPYLNKDNCNSIYIPLPEVEEQHAIAEALSEVDYLIGALEKLIAKKRAIKLATTQQLLTGKTRLPGFSGEWEQVPLIDVADRRIPYGFAGGPFGSNLKAAEYTTSGVRIIQLQNIGDGFFNDQYAIYTSKEKADELKSCNIFPGEIIISKMGDPVARACMLPKRDNRYLMASDGIRLAVDNRRFCTRFVHYYINFDEFRNRAIEASTGSTRLRIGLSQLKYLPFCVPALHEQTAIAKILSDMDAEITSLEQRRDKTMSIKQGMMQQLLTGRIRLIKEAS